ncbi:transposase, partial [bacterium]|nr:transposase [candidate division CSSED10-310 bacterium]
MIERNSRSEKARYQPSLVSAWIDDAQAIQVKAIDHLLNTHPPMLDTVAQDIMRPGVDHQKGAPGMSVAQVMRAAFVKRLTGCSYPQLAFWLKDSITYRRFCQYGLAD